MLNYYQYFSLADYHQQSDYIRPLGRALALNVANQGLILTILYSPTGVIFQCRASSYHWVPLLWPHQNKIKQNTHTHTPKTLKSKQTEKNPQKKHQTTCPSHQHMKWWIEDWDITILQSLTTFAPVQWKKYNSKYCFIQPTTNQSTHPTLVPTDISLIFQAVFKIPFAMVTQPHNLWAHQCQVTEVHYDEEQLPRSHS